MTGNKLDLATLVQALATQPTLPGLTPLNRHIAAREHRTAKVIEALLESARANSSLPRH